MAVQKTAGMQDVVSEKLPDATNNNPYYDSTYDGDPEFMKDKFNLDVNEDPEIQINQNLISQSSKKFQINKNELNILMGIGGSGPTKRIPSRVFLEVIDKTLKIKNVNFIGPDSGDQACGDVGEGRMSEPEDIAFAIAKSFSSSYLNGMRILITAGPTKEAIDPVRYLTNNSSGKMGYALAESAFLAGAQVDLVSGPVSINAYEGVNLHKINSADEMLEKIKTLINDIDIFIGCAAVADFKPKKTNKHKIKKTDHSMTIELTENKDILASVCQLETRPICIGFAAETENHIENAKVKLKNKMCDAIVLNDVSKTGIGLNSNDNEVHLITKNLSEKIEKNTKQIIAEKIIDKLANNFFQSS